MDIKILNKDFFDKFGDLSYSTPGSAGMDVRAAIDLPVELWPGDSAKLIPTGFALDMTMHKGIAAMLMPRSGLGHKHGLVLGNGVGLLDNDYQGEIFVSALNRNNPNLGREGAVKIKPGDRIAQIVFFPFAIIESFNFVDSFSETERGAGGFGSTGVA